LAFTHQRHMDGGNIIDNIVGYVRTLCAITICIVCLGPTIFLIGLIVLSTAPFNNTLELNINSMNAGIKTWNSSVYPVFSKTSFLFSHDGSSNVSLPLDIVADLQKQFGVNGLSYYLGSKYTSLVSYFSAVFNTSTMSHMRFTSGNVTFDLSTPLFKQVVTKTSNSSCYASNGVYNYQLSTCTTFYVMSAFCIKVMSQHPPAWELSTEYGGVGCVYDSESGSFLPPTYSKISPPTGAPIKIDIVATARHAGDPYILAEHLTKGSLNFGVPPLVIAGIGLFMMTIGGSCMLPGCILICISIAVCACLFARKGGRRGHTEYSAI